MKKINIILLIILTFVMISGINLRKQALEHKIKAEEYFQNSDWENAVKEYRNVVSYSPEMDNGIAVHFKKSQLEWAKKLIGKDNKKAYELLKDLVYTRPNYTIVFYYLGLLNERSKSYDDAQKYYEQFLEKDKGKEFHKEAKDKITSWKKDKEAYKNGVQFMANGDFALAYDEFNNIKTINKSKAKSFLEKITAILGNTPGTIKDNKGPMQNITNYSLLLKNLQKAINKKDAALLKPLIADNFISIIGNKDNFIDYYKNFCFELFTDIHFDYQNVTSIKISDSKLQISFDYTLKGIYNGKDMSIYNEIYKFGTENSIQGEMLFYIEKKDGKWQIVN